MASSFGPVTAKRRRVGDDDNGNESKQKRYVGCGLHKLPSLTLLSLTPHHHLALPMHFLSSTSQRAQPCFCLRPSATKTTTRFSCFASRTATDRSRLPSASAQPRPPKACQKRAPKPWSALQRLRRLLTTRTNAPGAWPIGAWRQPARTSSAIASSPLQKEMSRAVRVATQWSMDTRIVRGHFRSTSVSTSRVRHISCPTVPDCHLFE